MNDPDPIALTAPEADAAMEAHLDAEAEAAYAAGRVVPHDKVRAWLASWGTDDELPCPTP